MNLEELHSRAYDRQMYPDAFETIDVGGAVGKVSEPITGDEAYGMAKGVVQSELALPDFFESVAIGVYDMLKNPKNQGMLKSFVEGYNKEGVFPDLDKIKEMMKGILPEPSTESGKMSQEVGEMVAPGTLAPAIYKAGRKVLKKKSGAVAAPLAQDNDKGKK